MRPAVLLALTLALAAQAPVGRAAEAEAPPLPAMGPATLPLTSQFDLTSKITGRTYRIFVSRPIGAAPKGGFPVLYVLDGGMTYPIAAGQAMLGALGGRRQLLVVGVAYPNILEALTLRGRDLTPSRPDAATLVMAGGSKADDFGGGEDFHRFMMEELRPLIARTNAVDPADQSLMGYSLGGLFALHVMFHHPDAYRNYVAGSPSIWWNGREVLKGEADFASAVRAGKAAPRLLITSDGWEQSTEAPGFPASGKARARAVAAQNASRMIGNARELAGRLKAIKGPPGYEVRYALFPEETHNSGIPASTSRGVAFVTLR
jgi:uncharacterized protein